VGCFKQGAHAVTFFLQNLVNALQWGSFYALIALGYSMVYGVLMLFNFAHGDIFMVGAYIGFGVATGLVALASMGALVIPHWLILVLTILISMFLTSFVGAQRISFPTLIKSTTYNLGGVFVTNKKIMIVVVSIALMYALHLFVRKTRWGMAMRAMAFDFLVVPLLGVPINTIARLTFAIGSALAAVAGILFGVAYPVLDPYMGIIFGWKAFVAAILGGRGSILGACLAGFLLGFIEIFVAMIFPSTLRDFIAYSIILLILAFRPHGFFGEPYSARLRL
jgi:branched-chain amino acid transport system permease protein